MSAGDEAFPDDLTGHFWTQLDEVPDINRWRYQVIDYQDNVMAEGLAVSPAQAARFVRAWDTVVCAAFVGDGDPSLPWPEDPG